LRAIWLISYPSTQQRQEETTVEEVTFILVNPSKNAENVVAFAFLFPIPSVSLTHQHHTMFFFSVFLCPQMILLTWEKEQLAFLG
jgi:hypothetical protein